MFDIPVVASVAPDIAIPSLSTAPPSEAFTDLLARAERALSADISPIDEPTSMGTLIPSGDADPRVVPFKAAMEIELAEAGSELHGQAGGRDEADDETSEPVPAEPDTLAVSANDPPPRLNPAPSPPTNHAPALEAEIPIFAPPQSAVAGTESLFRWAPPAVSPLAGTETQADGTIVAMRQHRGRRLSWAPRHRQPMTPRCAIVTTPARQGTLSARVRRGLTGRRPARRTGRTLGISPRTPRRGGRPICRSRHGSRRPGKPRPWARRGRKPSARKPRPGKR